MKTLSSYCLATQPQSGRLSCRQKAFVIYTNVKEELGNWKTRKDNRFTKLVPNKTEIKHLESIVVSLVKEDPAYKLENYLWQCNCAIYSVATAWK